MNYEKREADSSVTDISLKVRFEEILTLSLSSLDQYHLFHIVQTVGVDLTSCMKKKKYFNLIYLFLFH